ncbi:MAG: hypothetical protein ACI4DS_04250 [Eubacterium sp.]
MQPETGRIGDKLYNAYNLMKQGNPEGAYEYFEAVAYLYMLDEIDERIFDALRGYIAVFDPARDLEPEQWLKALLLDRRYANVMYAQGELLDNLRKYLDLLPVITPNITTESFINGNIDKLKYADGAFFYIRNDKGLRFLVRMDKNGEVPLDFDVSNFSINRKEKRIEFIYIRGNKSVMSINYDGSDKKEITKEDKLTKD